MQNAMIDKVKETCTGCNACYSICPVDAIRMEPDAEGFLRPVIDWEICTRCNRCEEVCPVLDLRRMLNTHPPQVFAAWTRDEELRINSTSGGIFSELAKEILARGGYVAGARYKPDHTVEHAVISDVRDLPSLRQSKYLQSEMGHTFREVEKRLKTGAPVLFCGTPCHASGLLRYLDREYENLIVCDFICRGVTSPMVYKMYLADLEKEYGAPVETIQFKNKNVGWNQFCTFIKFKNGKTYLKDRYQDTYMYGYLFPSLYLRPCCYECKFKDIPRVADISLGDFWGIGNTRPHLDANKGTSVIFLNTSKGRKLFSSVKKPLICEECTFEEALAGNQHILHSAAEPIDRSRFFAKLRRTGSFLEVMQDYQKKNNSTPGMKKLLTRIIGIIRRH